MRDENQRRDSLQLPSQIRPLGCDRVTGQIQYLPRSKIFISDTTLSIFNSANPSPGSVLSQWLSVQGQGVFRGSREAPGVREDNPR